MNEERAIDKVLDKVNEADNILVALSRDPSVDDMAAAIGLTLALDKMGKHATAIYSGKTPNALQFLDPEKTFETDTNSLQDFIIALDKEKADHLRYKVEGDFVKVYITPYRTTIDEKDLEFSHGDFNVDLVISLNVGSADQLDAALSEYGRILHDAGVVNITNTAPGRLGEVEWSDMDASSVSEMALTLLTELKQEHVGKEIATALLTGIVAATERFSNARTTQGTMAVAAKLMGEGADQQLIVEHMNGDGEKKEDAPAEESKEKIDVEGEDKVEEVEEKAEEQKVGESAPTESVEPVEKESVMAEPEVVLNVQQPEVGEGVAVPTVEVPVAAVYNGNGADTVTMDDGTMKPLDEEKPVDYGAMMDAELGDQQPEPAVNPAIQAAPVAPMGPELNGVPQMNFGEVPADGTAEPSLNDMVNQMVQQAQAGGMQGAMSAEPIAQPAVEQPVVQPQVMEQQPVMQQSTEPVLPMPDGMTLPPPPTPPVDFSTMPPVQAMQPEAMQPEGMQPQMQVPVVPTEPEVPVDPSMAQLPDMGGTGQENTAEPTPEQVSPVVVQPVQDPGAFKIPGM